MFSNPTLDLNVSLVLLGFSVLFAFLFWLRNKKKFLALVIFSVLGNLSFLVNIGSRMYIAYSIMKLLSYFVFIVWPILNIYLLINYFSGKNEKA